MSRKDQFAGFASALNEEINNHTRNIPYETYTSKSKVWEQVELIIARRAYDLVWHTLEYHEDSALYACSTEDAVSVVPDMTELPKEQAQ